MLDEAQTAHSRPVGRSPSVDAALGGRKMKRDSKGGPRRIQRPAVSKRIPNCKLVTIEGAGHEVHVGNLSAFLTAVKSFLAS